MARAEIRFVEICNETRRAIEFFRRKLNWHADHQAFLSPQARDAFCKAISALEPQLSQQQAIVSELAAPWFEVQP